MNSSLIESTYKKVTQLEHILIRPDTYVGSIEKETQTMWVFDDETGKIVQKQITYVPGLYKIFDEILVNAADNKQRDRSMNTIKINIDRENNEISIWNNGKGLPIAIHKIEKKYVPTMIFGTLLTSSNYNDSEKKVTGGRNGYGAKLCNIFSSKFSIETASREHGKTFKQDWFDNMTRSNDPVIESVPKSKIQDFTCVKFKPDFTKFKMGFGLDGDIISLFKRRAYDIAASCHGVKVVLNGDTIPTQNLKDYAKLYLGANNQSAIVSNGPDQEPNLIYEKAGERWEICFGVSDTGFNHVSFVNSIATTSGGSHVNCVSDMIIKEIMGVINKKNKSKHQIKNFQVKNHMWLFVNCLIENPSFSSQTKETLTLNQNAFGSKPKFSDKFFKEVSKCGFVENVIQWINMKDQAKLAKTMTSSKTNKLRDVPKLDDANFAGTAKSRDCTLIITEGDSGKTMAISGLGVIGRDTYGVFPLRGKFLNVRDAATSKIAENAEVCNLIKILALNYKRKYTTEEEMKTLRYGRLMIMTDQDTDGSHIKGLVINFFDHFWPELLKKDFIQEFVTPIIKVKKGNSELPFYTLPSFEEWKSVTRDWNTWKVKYYKGLGTSTSDEAKEYFVNFENHKIDFNHIDGVDNDAISLAFSKARIEDRKNWLTTWMNRLHENPNLVDGIYSTNQLDDTLRYSDFINKELILFSYADLKRSIPSLMDGLKPTQRKVIYTCLKKDIIGANKERKVAQLAGLIGAEAAYHHGEASLATTMVNLAQNFVGSNNINLMLPIGQFGTRIAGGSDSASSRYIHTALTPIIKNIFHPDDTLLLKNQYDDNLKVEPEFYVPVIPMVLVNGAEGIGTGWSTKVPNFSPYEIISNLKLMINKQQPQLMHPYYKNFTGTIVAEDDTNSCYQVFGECANLGNDTVEITELPIKTWTQAYKENKLEPLLHGDVKKKIQPKIHDYNEYNTDTTVRFVVKMNSTEYDKCERTNSFHKFFSLIGSLRMTNCVMFNSRGCLKVYSCAQDVMDEFFEVRMEMYHARKQFLEEQLMAECSLLTNQARFIMEIINKRLIIERKTKKVVLKELVERKYDPNPVIIWKKKVKIDVEAEANEENNNEREIEEGEDSLATMENYNYLLTMQIFSLTKEKIDELTAKKEKKMTEHDGLKNTTAEQLWIKDLDTLETSLRDLEAKERKAEMQAIEKGSRAAAKNKKHRQANAKGSRKGAKTLNIEVNMKSNFKDPTGIRFVPTMEPKAVKVPKEKKTTAKTSDKKTVLAPSKTGAKKQQVVTDNEASQNSQKTTESSQASKSVLENVPQQKKVPEHPKITSFASSNIGKISKQTAKFGDNDEDFAPPIAKSAKVATLVESDEDSEIMEVAQEKKQVSKKATLAKKKNEPSKRKVVQINSSSEEIDDETDDSDSNYITSSEEDFSESE